MERITLGEALERYGKVLVIAATGAIAKKGSAPGGDIRVIFDGTNGVYLNLGIRIRDQVRFPTSCDIKAVLTDRLQDDFMRIKFHDRLLDGFELDDECHPKRFNHAEYLERVRALRAIRGPRCE